MKYYQNSKRISGHAALMFLMIFPSMFGIFVWATDGARILQSDARLTDAMEVAVLAVSAEGADKKVDRDATAKRFIESYFENETVTITSSGKAEKSEQDGDNEKNFFEYSLSVEVERETFFKKENAKSISYGDSFTMKRSAKAKKGLAEAVDVVLVADYSGSMADPWPNGGNAKYVDLAQIIEEIGDELENFNDQVDDEKKKSKLAVTGFSVYTFDAGAKERFHHLKCDSKEMSIKSGWRLYSGWLNEDCYFVGKSGYYTLARYQIHDVKHINIAGTISGIMDESIGSYGTANGGNYKDIKLTDEFDSIVSQVDNFKPGGSTASYTGLIRGAQLAKDGKNPRRLIIILSDGEDSYVSITNALLDKTPVNLCQKIVSDLNNDTTPDGDKIRTELAAIGLGYEINYARMRKCVGDGRVYEGNDKESIKRQILSLITEEVGSLVR